ncbi:MAG: RDD family protein [Actinomycetota bacterium]|nr:RDD family protein [Actinomycetota bacterium]MDP2289082.1 RDD family protein [Actinomycetota bacterium]
MTSPAPLQLPGKVAGLGRRLAAITIDWVASVLVASVIFPGLRPWSDNAALPILAVFFAEVSLFTWFFASSFGQRFLRVEVVDLAGRRLSLWRIALRTLLICLVIPAVIFDSQGRGLHDRAVGSVALRSRAS